MTNAHLDSYLPPRRVRPTQSDGLLELGVLDDPFLLDINEEHLARLQTALLDDVGGVRVENTHLRSHDHQVVFSHLVTRRSKADAVQDGAHVPEKD